MNVEKIRTAIREKYPDVKYFTACQRYEHTGYVLSAVVCQDDSMTYGSNYDFRSFARTMADLMSGWTHDTFGEGIDRDGHFDVDITTGKVMP